jgi:hypothetical protein
VISALIAFFVFYVIKKTIFDADKPLLSTRKVVPFFVFAIISVIIFSIFKGIEDTVHKFH